MKYDYHIIVIGAGSGGLVVASGAAGLGAKVALVEGHKMGGDCLNYGCVPSKSFLKAAHLAADIQKAGDYGLMNAGFETDLGKVMDRVQSIIDEIEPHDSKDRYEGLGVDVLDGHYGQLVDRHTVKVGDKTITGKYIVVSTGAEASIPPIPGLSEVSYLTNKTVFKLKTLPKRLIVLGTGPIGIELGQGFRHLGSEVVMVDMASELFGKDDPEVGPLMRDVLTKEGVELVLNAPIKSLSQEGGGIQVTVTKDGQNQIVEGDALLVALGRRPNTQGLNLEGVGVKTDRGRIVTNAKLQTNVSNIYACGDVTGPYQFTHMAGYQAGIVIRNTVFKLGAKVDYRTVPWVTFTKPEIAHVGETEPSAREKGTYHDHVLVPLQQMDRAKSDDDRHGFLKCVFDRKKRLIGATLVGEKAGEMISLAAMAIQNKQKVTSFMGLIFPYPTQSEIYKFASLSVVKSGFKPWMQTLIKKIFL
ncbi:FAD-dependent oxidoreductase [bacterium]|jgi:pyruvate/2-oxoglutarate dehydrogenase complex dihydrolipoamide dehydrogenase (E3) component|nr:FAD-dependent oxidoreductase [bacterium]